MSAATRPAPWWYSAPNPACAPFCDQQHGADEFARDSAMLCRKAIASTGLYVVEVQVYTGAKSAQEPGEIEVDPPAIWLEVKPLEPLTPDEAREFGLGLNLALAKAAAVCEGRA